RRRQGEEAEKSSDCRGEVFNHCRQPRRVRADAPLHVRKALPYLCVRRLTPGAGRLRLWCSGPREGRINARAQFFWRKRLAEIAQDSSLPGAQGGLVGRGGGGHTGGEENTRKRRR